MKVISSKRVKGLHPVAVLKKIKDSEVFDRTYKLYRIGNKFYIVERCQDYNAGCGVAVMIQKKDLKHAVCGGFGGFDSSGREFRCPRCGAENWVDESVFDEVFPALVSLAKSKCLKKSRLNLAAR